MARLDATVLVYEGPQARAYLARLRRAGLRPHRIVVLVADPIAERLGRAPGSLSVPGLESWAERQQDKRQNFHPRAIRSQHPDLVRRIATAMEAVVDDPMGFYREMYDDLAFDDLADEVVRVPANSYKDPTVAEVLHGLAPETVLFTGGGIVPASVLGIPGLRVIHVHTGFLPHVRGADVLLWSMLVRGRPGVSAFFMSPELDEGDVLATAEVAPLSIPLPATDRPDDDTLYRAVFSFIDPLIRAELLVDTVLGAGTSPAELTGTAQDTSVGLTYHFMQHQVRARALRALFPVEEDTGIRAGAEKPRTASIDRYTKYYEKVSALAPLRFAYDALRAPTSLRKLSLQNRQADYGALGDDPALLALHRTFQHHLVDQERTWDSYDYGEGYHYQSSDELGVTGLRDTTGRVEAFGLRELVAGRRALEIGCNAGFLSLAIAPSAEHVEAFELNPHLIAIAEAGRKHLGIDNVTFSVTSFEELDTDETYDDVLSFANHHTYDGNTHQSLEEFFERCHALTRPGGRLIFESHPPELEGDRFGGTRSIIERYYDIERVEVHSYGTFLDANRRFIVGVRR